MALIKIPKRWEISERLATTEDHYLNRRQFLKAMGLTGLGAFGVMTGCLEESSQAGIKESEVSDVASTIPKPRPPYPASSNAKYKVDHPITKEEIAASYNNFYEFTTTKDEVWKVAEKFETRPWEIEVTGHVHNRRTFDIDELLKKFDLEERVYRFRCVEAWSMVVPWVGFPLKKLIDEAQPTASAKYIRMLTFLKPEAAIGQKTQRHYPWPYYEGLRMDEAMHELTMLVTGSYGHALPNQHGAPIRLITPWKYGYKSIKSIVKIEFVTKQPATFWNDISPHEYDFLSNVDPAVPHPRWSQATERVIDTEQRIPTLPFNGYGEFVAEMYRA
jgi:sulfoxide reductase catalytic subunit YedY